jgi:hypothetical protein
MRKILDSPSKGNSDFLANAGISNWPLRIFAINISLKTIPSNMKVGKILFSLFAGFLTGYVLHLSIMHIRTTRTPEN